MKRVADVFAEILSRTWAVLGEMSPWVLGGFAMAGVVSLWLNARVVREHFGRGRMGAVLKAVALGVPLPVCSCGVIPLGASLRKHGAGKGATAAFLMSTPQTGVDSIAVTFGMMGWLFALLRPLAALVSGVACGFVVDWMDGDDSSAEQPEPELESENRPWWKKVLANGFVVLPRSVGGALLVGALVSATVMTLMPEHYVAEKISSPLLQMVLTLLFGIPVYICSTAAVPFALGLLAAGLSPGAVMAFLIGGPGVSASTLLAVWKLMGLRTTIVYAAVLIICALVFGWGVQSLLPPGWQPDGFQTMADRIHCEGSIPWRIHVQAALLLAVVAWAKWGPRKKGRNPMPRAVPGLAMEKEN